MADPHDNYRRLEIPAGVTLHECPVCGADAELWQYSESATAPTSKVVCCSMGDRFGPQDGIADEGCLLYMPPNGHYRATIREAVKYWHEYAKVLMQIQRANRWKRHSALRTPTGQGEAP